MRNTKLLFAVLSLFAAASPLDSQSLADAARREAERRKSLDERGVGEKVIGEVPSCDTPAGTITTSRPEYSRTPRASPAPSPEGASLRSCRSTIARLDRQIRSARDAEAVLRARLENARREEYQTWKPSRVGVRREREDQLREQALAAGLKLRRLQDERLATWDACRKAGHLPGELEGRGSAAGR